MGSVQSDTLLRQAQLFSESAMRSPFSTIPWGSLLQHLVNLLEGETLHLRDEEVGESHGEDTEGSPDKEDLCSEVGVSFLRSHEVGSDDGDDLYQSIVSRQCISLLELDQKAYAVPEPVRHQSVKVQYEEEARRTYQLLAVDKPTPRARIGSGNISPTTICSVVSATHSGYLLFPSSFSDSPMPRVPMSLRRRKCSSK